jgi:hypothetical protein
VVLQIELRALGLLSKCSTTEQQLQPKNFEFFFFCGSVRHAFYHGATSVVLFIFEGHRLTASDHSYHPSLPQKLSALDRSQSSEAVTSVCSMGVV